MKEKSSHPPQIKKAIFKGFTERAHRLCDKKEHLNSELKNIEEIFIANGYPRQQIRNIVQEKGKPNKEEKAKKTRGTYVIPYIEGLSQAFKRIANKRNFEIAMKSGRKVKDLKTNARHPLGEKRTDVVYKIPCGCGKFEYIGETGRKWATRKKEHQ